jgi:hypothetical protein
MLQPIQCSVRFSLEPSKVQQRRERADQCACPEKDDDGCAMSNMMNVTFDVTPIGSMLRS